MQLSAFQWMTGLRSNMNELLQLSQQATTLTVRIEELRTTANAIHDERMRFRNAFQEVLNYVNALSHVWQDETNEQTTIMFDTYRADIIAMDQFFGDKIEFLRASADRYEATLNQVKANAQELIRTPRSR